MNQQAGPISQPATHQTHIRQVDPKSEEKINKWIFKNKKTKKRDTTLCKFIFRLLTRHGRGHFMQHLIDLLPAWLYSNIYWKQNKKICIKY